MGIFGLPRRRKVKDIRAEYLRACGELGHAIHPHTDECVDCGAKVGTDARCPAA